eukprot:218617_1
MGHYFVKQTPKEHEIPQIEVGLQMNYILTYWFRTNKLYTKYGYLSVDIIRIIINTYTYQKIFDIDHKYKLKKMEHEKNGKFSTDLNSHIEGKYQYSGDQYDFLFKILLIGDSNVGKTSFLSRYVDDSYTSSFINSIGIDFKLKTIQMDTKIIKLQIWDTMGQQRFRTITSSYYRGCEGILILYDITDKESFENTKRWNREIEQYAAEYVDKVLVGNKLDLNDSREVLYNDSKKLCKQLDISHCVEVSAKTGKNIELPVHMLIQQVLLRRFGITERRMTKPFID